MSCYLCNSSISDALHYQKNKKYLYQRQNSFPFVQGNMICVDKSSFDLNNDIICPNDGCVKEYAVYDGIMYKYLVYIDNILVLYKTYLKYDIDLIKIILFYNDKNLDTKMRQTYLQFYSESIEVDLGAEALYNIFSDYIPKIVKNSCLL